MDFDARVPIPFSVFPSTYRDASVNEETKVKVQGEVEVDRREGIDSRYSYGPQGPRRENYRKETRVFDQRPYGSEEDVHIDIEERREQRGRTTREKIDVDIEADRSQYRDPYRRYADTQFDVNERVYNRDFHGINNPPRQQGSDIDIRQHREEVTEGEKIILEDNTKRHRSPIREEIVERERITVEQDYPRQRNDKMGYYDDEGHYHSFRHGLHRAADRVLHPFREDIKEEVDVNINLTGPRSSGGYDETVRVSERSRSGPPNTITIPCHHIRIGDLLILQGRPCQVIRISTSAQTGQHRYLGVDLFNKQLYEETSFASNPSPSVYVQNMLGPVFKQYRVLDIRGDGRIVAMTESGNIKQGMQVLEQGGLLGRLSDAFDKGRGSVRVLVINDSGRELAVDMKVMHGSRL